jgi:hypothetical protein
VAAESEDPASVVTVAVSVVVPPPDWVAGVGSPSELQAARMRAKIIPIATEVIRHRWEV